MADRPTLTRGLPGSPTTPHGYVVLILDNTGKMAAYGGFHVRVESARAAAGLLGPGAEVFEIAAMPAPRGVTG